MVTRGGVRSSSRASTSSRIPRPTRGCPYSNRKNRLLVCEKIFEVIAVVLDSQVLSAIIGSFVTIFGVWLTIRNDRKMRRLERCDEVKPALAVRFIELEQPGSISNFRKGKRSLVNRYKFYVAPIFETVSSCGVTGYSGYDPYSVLFTEFASKAQLLFQVHVDGSFPVCDISLTAVRVVDPEGSESVLCNRLTSIGHPIRHVNSIFDLYHKHNPSNFDRNDFLEYPDALVDESVLDKYISPNSDVVLCVPVRIGFAPLRSLIKFVREDEEFRRTRSYLDFYYNFNDPDRLYCFLRSLNSMPVQVCFEFNIIDIDGNVISKRVNGFACLLVQWVDEICDYLLTVDFLPSSPSSQSCDYIELEHYIFNLFADQ